MLGQPQVRRTVQSLEPLTAYPQRDGFDSVVLVRPDHFTVDYCINPYMVDSVDEDTAREQWVRLAILYQRLADELHIVNPSQIWDQNGTDSCSRPPGDLPDMVYCSNHAVPGPDGTTFYLANMSVPEREGETDYFKCWAEREGYETVSLPDSLSFEGNGDAKWHPGRQLLWGGYGPRTDRRAYDVLAEQMGVDIITLELTADEYYHLDVCFSPLDEHTVLICPDAFTDTGLEKINTVWERVIRVPADEVQQGFACNCHSVDGEQVVIEEANEVTYQRLREAGFEPVEVPTSEFIKGGGSISCLTMAFD